MAEQEDYAAHFSWSATQKTLADGRVLIRVIGTCERPARPLRAGLSRAPFQSSNRNVLVLALQTEIVPRPAGLKLPTITVAYEQTGNQRYRLVSIHPGSIGIAVEEEDGQDC